MPEKSEIRDAIFRALSQVRALMLDASALRESESLVLLGEGAELDSMSFVNFIVAVEEEVSRISDRPLDLVGLLDRQKESARPLSTVGHIIDLVHTHL